MGGTGYQPVFGGNLPPEQASGLFHPKPSFITRSYLVYDPLIAEIHRAREALYRESQAEPLVLKDEPLRKRHGDFPMTKLSLPLTEEKVHALKVGDEVLISGSVFIERTGKNARVPLSQCETRAFPEPAT